MSTPSQISKPPTVTESLAAAARRLDCSTRTIRRRVADGSLTGYRFGPRLIRVSVAEVDALLSLVPTTQAS
jgi:excisionase family DNA binding protein